MNPGQRGWIVAVAVAAFSAGFAADARAQTRSTITGTIRNGVGKPLPEVTVTLESPTMPGQMRTTLTSDRGLYRLPEVTPGLYDLTASLPGWQTVRRAALRVPVGFTLTMDFTLAPGEAADLVTISGPGPIVDVTTPASTTNLTTEDLENLPITSGAAIVQLVPGVTPRTILGGGVDSRQLMVDGSPITVTLRMGAPSALFHVYWMQEAQIAGLGANAEHGDSSGLIANIVTRSGGNRLSGLFEHRFAPPAWVADNTRGLSEALRGEFPPLEILSDWATEGQVGGPLKRNRVFFFAGLDYFRTQTVQPGTLGNVPLDVRRPAFLVKLNSAPLRSLRIEGWVEGYDSRLTGSLLRNALPETAADSTTQVRSWNARGTWSVNESTLADVHSSGVDYSQSVLSAGRRTGPPRRFDRISGITSGNAANYSDSDMVRHVSGGHLTRFVDGAALGGHEIEVGAEVERTSSHQLTGFPGGRFFTDALQIPGTVQLWAGDTIESTGTRTSLYAQDRWRASSRVSIHPGVRVGFNRGSVPDKGPTFKTNPVSPRLGVAWDVGADHKTVVRGSYGRFHEGLYPTLFDFMNTSGRTPVIMARVLGPEAFEEVNRSAAPVNRAVDEDLEHAYVDQYVIGAERELFPDFSLTGQYVRRNFERIWAMTDTGSRYAPVQGRDPGPDARLGTSDDGDLLTVFNVVNPGQSFLFLTNPEEALRRHDTAQVIGQKRFSRGWQALVAYTWSRTTGTVNGMNGANRGSSFETGINGVFFNPNRRINADGPVSFDYRHQVNVLGTYFLRAAGGVSLSGSYSYLGGGAWGRTALITSPQLLQGQTVRIEPRGTRRIQGASTLDLRLEKTFRLGSSQRTLGIYADIFNVTNEGTPLALTVVEGSGATFGQPTEWATPRYVQVAGRFRF